MHVPVAMDINLQKMAELVSEIEICACLLVETEALVNIVGAPAPQDGLVVHAMKILMNARQEITHAKSMNASIFWEHILVGASMVIDCQTTARVVVATGNYACLAAPMVESAVTVGVNVQRTGKERIVRLT